MDQLQFRVSAELKNILGRDLITSDNIAVLELVKNSYDAHATKVEITFGNDSIVIADNGKGMSAADISDKWLFIAYSAKSDGTEDDNYRSKIRRDFAGAKGIGRLSCDRLARYLTMNTVSEETDTLEILKVDWAKFENRQKENIDTIPVEHESTNGNYVFPDNSSHGTSLSFTGLHGKWGVDEIFGLRKSLEKMIAPLAGADDFKIEIIAPNFTEHDDLLRTQISEAKERYEDLNDRERAEIAKWENSILNGPIRNSISDVLKIKTTQIESKLRDGKIVTRLSDRGVLMYEIEEDNKYSKLEEASVDLYYLNRAAKYNFSLLMGMTPVNYGNVFLFRNGFRIMPYGEYDDDSWGLNQRSQQGYNRNLSTRELFGRVDVHSDSVNMFKEVSSRDGGLIDSEETRQLHAYFDAVERRLERYVSGVLWGEAFLRNDYFRSERLAQEAREDIRKDKDSDNPDDVFKNIGSRVDFLQLVKSLVNDNSITVHYYNSSLADILSNATETEMLNAGFLDDVRKVAERTNDETLQASIAAFERRLAELQRSKEEAEKKNVELEAIQKELQKELDAQQQRSQYLISTRNLTQEVQDINHAISINSTELVNLISNLSGGVSSGSYSQQRVLEKLREASFYVNKIKQLSMLITKADIVSLKNKQSVDVMEYVQEYVSNFKSTLDFHVDKGGLPVVRRMLSLLDIAIVLDNLISNSKKNGAKNVGVFFAMEGGRLILDFSDNGYGVDLDMYTPESIFNEGVTNKSGGSGIGLSTIRFTMENKLNGSVVFLGNGLHGMKGATFRLVFN